ncbi:NAD(P)-dependent oxidoreductase [Saccharibacillus kuerlensis]|uniref:Oxidoreductase n=1 Tax=Saccharibacillus kuerlensis TaxID=459527 RepID=A0ABQ2L3M1_9BACL|nr:SDR family oxidoreductase [Saccharibacillus kuerlensis]GGN99550.1 oxidoreductase [Saccharibacillus kuerlensis]
MHISILGATGRVGSQIVKLALRDGHRVTALVRDPGKVDPHNRLTVVQGDVLNEEDVKSALHEAEIVVSALNTDGTTTLSQSMPLIIEQMRSVGITRIVTIGTAGILQSRTEPGLLRYQSNESKCRLTRAAEEHHRVYSLLEASDLEWTLVCPTYLPDDEYLGIYRVERDFLPEDGMKISVADTAEFAYKQIEDRHYVRCRVGIAY